MFYSIYELYHSQPSLHLNLIFAQPILYNWRNLIEYMVKKPDLMKIDDKNG